MQIDTPRWAKPLLAPSRYKGAFGGRGSGKSHFFAESVVESMVMDPACSVVCIREVQKSLKFSAKRLIEDKIAAFGVSHLFDVQTAEIKRRGGPGVCIFQGMQDHTADSIKSLEGFKIAWVEEAQALSEKSLRLLRPTMRAPGAEIWFSWNPDQPDDPVDGFMRKSPPPGAIVVQVNYTENPWFPDELRAEAKFDRQADPEAFEHVWRGGYNIKSEAQVFAGRYQIEEFDPKPGDGWDGPYYGADWGFAQDPTVLVKAWLRGDKVWVEKESGKIGLDTDRTGGLWQRQIPEAQIATIRGDSARPETISYLQRHDWPGVIGVDKWPGSVEDGVEWLRARQLVIHPRCERAAREARLYRYKQNKAGDVLAQIEDANNHVMDALRYAFAPVIRQRSVKSETGHVTGLY